MRALRTIVISIILFSLPFIARAAYFHRGIYEPRPVPRPIVADIDVPTPALADFVDTFEKPSKSVVVFDFAHNNNFKETELNVLLSRLAARGSRPEYMITGDQLDKKLRRAQSFVVISPRAAFSNEEIRTIKRFVETGGKVLLVTDPTRYDVTYDVMGLPSERRSDVADMNMLAAPFGLVFRDDYLYNIASNAGSYKDIILTNFADSPITKGIQELIFVAAHSIATSGTPIIWTDEGTRSSLTERQGGLAVAVLTGAGRVLGIGDFTFLTEPHASLADNEQLVSNIADFLVTGRREYALADFPYFFGDRVDLMYAGKEAIGGDVLSKAGLLQSEFDAVGKKLTPRKPDSLQRDALFIGLYDGTEYIQSYLATRQISITLQTTETDETAQVTPTTTITATRNPGESTPAPTAVSIDEVSFTETLSPTVESAETAPREPPIEGTISVAELGEFPTESVTLISLGEEEGDNKVMIVLAATPDSLAQTLGLLAQGDLSQCLTSDRSALCPSTPSVLPATTDEFYIPPPKSEIPMTITPTELIEPIEIPPS